MILFKKAGAVRDYIFSRKAEGLSWGWVPTMGALHPGHLSLVEAASESNDLTICSIFVNPTQFNISSDFQKYPKTIEQDIYLLEQAGTDILFLPDLEEIYPQGTEGLEQYDLGTLENILEGQYRPGHFQGVCQVMSRMLRLIEPDNLYMGEKDYQQCLVIRRLLNILHSNTVLHTRATFREPDGLAMSSRNLRLNPMERKHAVAIHEALLFLKNNLKPGDLSELIRQAEEILLKNDFRIDYVVIADRMTLEPQTYFDGKSELLGLVAAFQHEVRLIDNMTLTV